MSDDSVATQTGSPWLIHDVLIGLLAGAGVGSLVGVFIAVRWFDTNIPTLVGALVGAAIGILILLKSHQRNEKFLTASVVLSWVLLVASGSFIAALAFAIATFE